MKKLLFLLLCVIAITTAASAQSDTSLLQTNRAFTGATAKQKHYNAIYQLDTNDPKIIEKAIRNINNSLKDPRLAGKIKIELVAFSGGTEAYLKGGKFEEELKALVEKGVIVSQCHNSLIERKISRDQIYDFIGIVPSGAGEVIIRQADGWSVVKP